MVARDLRVEVWDETSVRDGGNYRRKGEECVDVFWGYGVERWYVARESEFPVSTDLLFQMTANGYVTTAQDCRARQLSTREDGIC